MWINSGDPTLFSGEDGVGGGIQMAIEKDFGPIAGAINFGYRYSPYAQFDDLDLRHRLPVSLSLSIPTSQTFAFNVEAAAQPSIPFDKSQNPSELYGGVNYRATREVAVTGGAAVGSFNNYSSGDYRVVLGLRFAPVSSDPLPKPVQAAGRAPAPAPQPTAPIVVEKTIVKLVPTPERVVFTDREIQMRDEIIFEHNSAILAKPSKELLKEVAAVIKRNEKRFRKILVEGHANELGNDKYNLRLSRQRAQSVKAYLATLGVPASKLGAVGYGKRKPWVTETSGYKRDTRLVLNRRVKFTVVQ
jgi:outer membrane protein OmpA-like peptidoglycan-associated protein